VCGKLCQGYKIEKEGTGRTCRMHGRFQELYMLCGSVKLSGRETNMQIIVHSSVEDLEIDGRY